VPVFVILLMQQGVWFKSGALLVFIIASITDYYDGLIARRKKLITAYGIFMDPLADKLLLGAAFVAFLFSSRLGLEAGIPWWLVWPIVARELGITLLRSWLAARDVALPAGSGGKFKTVLQMITVIYILTLISGKSLLLFLWETALQEAFYLKVEAVLLTIPWYLMLLTMLVTVVTGLHYLRELYRGRAGRMVER